MKTTKLTKQDYIRIGTFSLALAVGTACSVLGVSVVGVPVAMLGTVLASIAGGIVTNEVSPILSPQETDKDTLKTNDLTRIVGKSIAAVIVAVADSKQQFDKGTETNLRKMAKLAEENWENILKNLPGEFAPIEESQLTEFFTTRPEDFNNLTALDVNLWESLLTDLQRQTQINLDQSVINDTANRLHQIFPKALREVLKEDFKSDGKGFAGMVLDLFAVMRSQLTQNHDELEKLELFTQKSQDEIAADLKSVAGQIDSGFQNALQEMGVLQTDINKLLFDSKAILDSLEYLNKQSQQRHEELKTLIEINSDPKIVQTKYWQLLREKATSPANWIRFLTEEDKQKVLAGETRVRRPSRPASVEKITEKIPVNQPLYLEVNLEYPQHRLLLVNGNTEGKYLFCPSLDFAPDSILEKPPFVLPQAGSWAEQNGNNEKIFFEDVRLEEFMGIILGKDVNFDWMKPSEEESLPEWNGQRIMDVFNHLEQSGEWQVFYQSFEVL